MKKSIFVVTAAVLVLLLSGCAGLLGFMSADLLLAAFISDVVDGNYSNLHSYLDPDMGDAGALAAADLWEGIYEESNGGVDVVTIKSHDGDTYVLTVVYPNAGPIDETFVVSSDGGFLSPYTITSFTAKSTLYN